MSSNKIENSLFDQLNNEQTEIQEQEPEVTGKYKILLMPYGCDGGQSTINRDYIPRKDEHIILDRHTHRCEYVVMLVIHNGYDTSYDVALQIAKVKTL